MKQGQIKHEQIIGMLQQAERGEQTVAAICRAHGMRGYSVQPRRWVVERSFAWLLRNRRLAKGYARKVQTSETLIELAIMRLLLRRLATSITATNATAETCQPL